MLLADGNSISSVLLSFFRSPPLTLVELLAVRVHHADLEDVLEDEGRGHLEKVGRREVMKKKKSRLRWAKKVWTPTLLLQRNARHQLAPQVRSADESNGAVVLSLLVACSRSKKANLGLEKGARREM